MKTATAPSKAKVQKYLRSLGIQDATIDRTSDKSVSTHVDSVKDAYHNLKAAGLVPRKINDDKCVFSVPRLGRIVLRKHAKALVIKSTH